MKLSKFFLIGLSAMALAVTGCDVEKPYEEISGIDKSKAKPTELTLDEDNSSTNSISVYWDGAEAVRAGALSFTAQLVTSPESAGDNYNSTLSKTSKCLDDAGNINDAASFVKLTKGAMYYVRVRANYAYSVYSDWTYLERDGAVIQVSVGNGYVVSEFTAPKDLSATAATYSSINVKWSMIGPAAGYEVSMKKTDAADWTVLGETAETSWAITGLDQLTSYDIRVRAFKGEGEDKEYSDYSTANGVATPEKPAFNPSITAADQLAQFFSEIAAQSGTTDKYTLDADIDLTGVDIVNATAFAGELDGKGHTIKGLSANDALIGELSGTFKNIKFTGAKITNYLIKEATKDAAISGIELDATSEFTYDAPVEGTNYGAVVGENAGTVASCKSAAKSNVEFASMDGESNVGGIVGKSTGLVQDCSFSGSLALNLTAPKKALYHTLAGVVGLATGTEGNVIVKGCTNSGSISVTFATSVYFNVAGVVGSTVIVKQSTEDPTNQGIIDDCHNTGAISSHYIAGGSGAYPMVGGVCGTIDGYVQNCTNDGPISLVCDSETSSAAWTCMRVGGVAGTITFGAKDLTNKANGKITIKAMVAGGTAGARGAGCIETSCWGGVAANAGPYVPNNGLVFENCVNEANIDITASSTTGTPNHHVGAVFGYSTAKLLNCSNKGSFKFTSPVAYSRLGGIVGGAKADVVGCTNSGNLTLDMGNLEAGSSVIGTGKFACYLGGIVGCTRLAATNINITDCTNTGNLTLITENQQATSLYNSYVVGILACYKNSDATTPVISNCTNSGTLSFTGSQSVKTADMIGGQYQEAKN